MIIYKKNIMTEEEFDLLSSLIRTELGILLKGDKRLTLHTKISHRLSILGLETYRDYYNYLAADSSKEELFVLASHITNNETYFFREKAHLDLLPEILKEIKKNKQRKSDNALRVLSLASSTGEEAYSLNMIIQESGLFLWDWDIKITGMDIDKIALKKACEACYTNNSFREVNHSDYIQKYFKIEGDRYILKKAFMKNVEFKYGNLIDRKSFHGLENTDIIFCRNVLIYMSDEAIQKAVWNFYLSLSDSGYLIIGSSESLIQRTNLFVPEYINGVIVYRKTDTPSAHEKN